MKMKRKPYAVVSLTKEEKKALNNALEILNQVLKDTKDGTTDLNFEVGSIISSISIASDIILRNAPREEE